MLGSIDSITWKQAVGSYTDHATKKRTVIAAGSNTYGYCGQSVRDSCMRKKSGITRKKLPIVRTDRAAESLVDRGDLSGYDLTRMRPVRFEFAPRSARLNMRLPGGLLTALKDAAAESGVPY